MYNAKNLTLKKRNLSFLLITIIALSMSYFVILVYSKMVRSFFLPPEILSNKIIGAAQYYGYSFYFDYLFLFAVILDPIIVITLLYFVLKIYDRDG